MTLLLQKILLPKNALIETATTHSTIVCYCVKDPPVCLNHPFRQISAEILFVAENDLELLLQLPD